VSRKRIGDCVTHRVLKTIHGQELLLPDIARPTHLQFRRYSGCPACNLHLRTLAQRHEEIVAAGIREVVVFHSARDTMLDFQAGLPFAAIADPKKILYYEFGVEQMSAWLAFHPRSWRAAYRALTRAPSLRGAMGQGEAHMGLPADFLIGVDGRILAAKYGRFVDDHWSVEDLLALPQPTAVT
jgi:peroxiredoxin